MRITIMLLAIALLVGACATPQQGPGATCTATEAEARPVGDGSQAAAAAATGGQRANQAPFAEDTARLAPQTTIGRGQGATTSNSADSERRHVASGGAQNLGVVLPTHADAKNLGGTSPAIAEAAKTVASYRAMLQCALLDPMTPPDRIELLTTQITKAQEALAAAQSAATVTHVTNNNFQSSRIQQFGVSTSATNKDGETINPEVVKPMAEAAARMAEGALVEYEETPAPAAPEASPEPPVADGGGS